MKLGIFDSGVGGLTVLKAIRTQFPNIDIAYLGDTARVPYGIKSEHSICRYAEQAIRCLIQERQVDAVIIACNTASAFALSYSNSCFPDLDIFGVIEPGAEAALQSLPSNPEKALIGVLATESTIKRQAYVKAIQRRFPTAQVVGQACQMLVALAEEGWTEGTIAELTCQRYLQALYDKEERWPDSIILGCTHFPILQETIQKTATNLGASNTCIVNSSNKISEHLLNALSVNLHSGKGMTEYLITDGIERFVNVGSRFLSEQIAPSAIQLVDLHDNPHSAI